MRALWVALETIDVTAVRLLESVDRLLGRAPFAERATRATEQTPEPTPAPKFEK
jgi:hypothetical protein